MYHLGLTIFIVFNPTTTQSRIIQPVVVVYNDRHESTHDIRLYIVNRMFLFPTKWKDNHHLHTLSFPLQIGIFVYMKATIKENDIDTRKKLLSEERKGNERKQ